MDKNTIDTVTSYDFLSFDRLDDYFVIILNNKLYAPENGRTFHDDYNQAWKHFYRDLNWRVKSQYKKDYATKTNQTFQWGFKADKTDRQIWEDFKATLAEKYDFRIIRWKYAKEDVCGTRKNGND